jgi:hypothetical protein
MTSKQPTPHSPTTTPVTHETLMQDLESLGKSIDKLHDTNAALQAENRELLEALQALGTYPGGYCFCPEGRDAGEVNAFGNAHTGECEDARKALAKAEGK